MSAHLTELKKQHPGTLVISIFHTLVCMCFMSQQRLISPTHCHRIILCDKAQSETPTKWKRRNPQREKSRSQPLNGSQSHRPRRSWWELTTTISGQERPQGDWRLCKGISCMRRVSSWALQQRQAFLTSEEAVLPQQTTFSSWAEMQIATPVRILVSVVNKASWPFFLSFVWQRF